MLLTWRASLRKELLSKRKVLIMARQEEMDCVIIEGDVVDKEKQQDRQGIGGEKDDMMRIDRK